MKKRKIIIGITAVVLLFSFVLIYKLVNNAKTKNALNQKSAATDTATVITASGNVRAVNTFQVTPVVGGKVTKVYFKEGDKVKTNDLMFEIDSSDAEMNIEKLESTVEQAKLQLKSDLAQIEDLAITAPFSGQLSNILVKKGDVIITKGTPIATLEDRSKLKLTVPFNEAQISEMATGLKAEVYLNNINQVVEGRVSYISRNSHATDDSGKLYNVEILIDNPGALKEGQTASAAVDAASGQISSPRSGMLKYINSVIIQANSTGTVENIGLKEDQFVNAGTTLMTLKNDTVSAAKATDDLKIQDLQSQLDYAQKQLENYKIYSPMDGTISKQDIKEGEIRNSGQVISTISDLEHLELVVDVDDTDIANIKLGQKAKVKIDALSETSVKPLELEVVKIAVEGDTINGTTTYPVTLSINNTADIKIGMNANIEITVDKKQ